MCHVVPPFLRVVTTPLLAGCLRICKATASPRLADRLLFLLMAPHAGLTNRRLYTVDGIAQSNTLRGRMLAVSSGARPCGVGGTGHRTEGCSWVPTIPDDHENK